MIMDDEVTVKNSPFIPQFLKKIIITLSDKRFTTPDGAYIWKEDKTYKS